MVRLLVLLLALCTAAPSWAASHGRPTPTALCTRLLMAEDNNWSTEMDANNVFTSLSALANRTGDSGPEYTFGQNFFSGSGSLTCNPTVKIVRSCTVACRPHLNGGNIAGVTVSGTGTVELSYYGQILQAAVDTSSCSSPCSGANLATFLAGALNSARPAMFATTGSTLAAYNMTFQGYQVASQLLVTNLNSNAALYSGSQICDYPAGSGSQVLTSCTHPSTLNLPTQQNTILSTSYSINATTNNPAQTVNVANYTMFLNGTPGSVSSPEWMTAYYQVLTVGTLTSGTIFDGLELTGTSISGKYETIMQNLTGGTSCSSNPAMCGGRTTGSFCTGSACNGSTWVVSAPVCGNAVNGTTNCSGTTQVGQTYSSVAIGGTLPLITLSNNSSTVSGTQTFDFLQVQQNSYALWSNGTLGWMMDVSGTIAAQSQLTCSYQTPTGYANLGTGEMLHGGIGTRMSSYIAEDPNWGTFQTGYTVGNPACGPQSATNWNGGPQIPYGVDDDLVAWTQSRTGQTPYYMMGTLGNCGAHTTSVTVQPGAH